MVHNAIQSRLTTTKDLMKYILSILISLVFALNAYSFTPVEIFANGENQYFDLSGRDGFDGKHGLDAYSLDCSDGLTRRGRVGESGDNGEDGESGRSAIVYFESLQSLDNILLNQSGGLGGNGGDGGLGTFGCNGGAIGQPGTDGVDGEIGRFGQLFLVKKNQFIERRNTARVISLGEFNETSLELSEHLWTEVFGAKNLFHKDSIIGESYSLFDHTEHYTINLDWRAENPIWMFFKTKLALSIRGGELSVSSYSGAVIDYRVTRIGNSFTITVLDAIHELALKNLSLGKLRGSGEDLSIEVKEKYKPRVMLTTKFVISIYHNIESTGKDVYIGSYPIDEADVTFQDGCFDIKFGHLNFPSKYKKINTKLRIHLSIYREANRQTRVLGIKGLFKI